MANPKHTKSQSIDVSSPSSPFSGSHGRKAIGEGLKLHMAPLLKYKALVGGDEKHDKEVESGRKTDTEAVVNIHPPKTPANSTPSEKGEDRLVQVMSSPETPTIRQVTEPGSTSTPLKITTSNSAKHHTKGSKSSPASPYHPPQSLSTSPTVSQTPVSPADPTARSVPQRPGGATRRSSSQEKNFFNKIKKGHQAAQEQGTRAVGILNKFGHGAWDKLKTQRERLAAPKPGGGRSSSPQQGHRYDPRRDTSRDVDVFGMDLKDAVERTRVEKERKNAGDVAFWIPAIAYRCIQYLNVHGPKEVGIYRIPGSTTVMDDLRMDFKIYHDVDLFEHPPNDLHTVSSLLKSWLRNLPNPVIPKEIQTRMYERCKEYAEDVHPPREFIEELSKLPPYNYYLLNYLFSHLSAINDASEINKMNLANLGMVFCPTLRMDRFAFNWLAGSFANCWTEGCATEEDEYQVVLQIIEQRAQRRASFNSAVSSSLGAPASSNRPASRDTTRTTSSSDKPPPSSSSSHLQFQTPPQSSSGPPVSAQQTPKSSSPKRDVGTPVAAPAESKEEKPASLPPTITTAFSSAAEAGEESPSLETRVIRGLEALKSENGSQYSHGERTDSMIVQTGRLSLGNALDMKGSAKEATILEDDGAKSSNLPNQESATEKTADAAEAKKEAEVEKKK